MLINMLGKLKPKFIYTGEKNERTLLLILDNGLKRHAVAVPAAGMWRFKDLNSQEKEELAAIFAKLREVGVEKLWRDTPQRMVAETLAAEDYVYDTALSLFDMSVALRVGQDNSTLYAILDQIRDNLDQLHRMPPYTKEKKAVAGFTATVNGETHSGEIME